MADYWMKLYIEILDDPKMATLPDRIWRRIIELFLIAKRTGKDGHIPETRQLAWMLRMNADDLEHDMMQISSTGIVEREVNGWFIPKFMERQSAVPDRERKAQQRERDHSRQYNGNVTDSSRNVTQSTESDNRVQSTESETEQSRETPAPFDIIQHTLETKGIIVSGVADIRAINDLVTAGAQSEDILEAIAWKADHNNGRPLQYASQIIGPAKTAIAKRLQVGAGAYGKTAYTGPNGETRYM